MTRRHAVIAGIALSFILAVGVLLGWYRSEYGFSGERSTATIGGPFTLVDQDGRTVTDRTYRDKWLVIYFGFTFCPDACPTTLSRFADMLTALGADAARVQPLFISVDPDRDTPAALRDYVAAFDRRIVGLTGTPAQIAAVARSYRAYYQRVGSGPDYSIVIYLVDPDGRFETLLPHDASGQDLAARLRKLL